MKKDVFLKVVFLKRPLKTSKVSSQIIKEINFEYISLLKIDTLYYVMLLLSQN